MRSFWCSGGGPTVTGPTIGRAAEQEIESRNLIKAIERIGHRTMEARKLLLRLPNIDCTQHDEQNTYPILDVAVILVMSTDDRRFIEINNHFGGFNVLLTGRRGTQHRSSCKRNKETFML